MPTSVAITFGGEELMLRADRTLYWPRAKTLLATDLHAGKAAHMRHHGLAIPGGNLDADLIRLGQAIKSTGTERLIFLGDLFHSEPNVEWRLFADWCHQQTATIELVRGNHDRFLTADMFASAGLVVRDEPYTLAPFSLRHHPAAPAEAEVPVIAGHIHPVTYAIGTAKDRLRLVCFWHQSNQLILPAFGSLTGGFVITRSSGEQRYVCAPDFSTIIPMQ